MSGGGFVLLEVSSCECPFARRSFMVPALQNMNPFELEFRQYRCLSVVFSLLFACRVVDQGRNALAF